MKYTLLFLLTTILLFARQTGIDELPINKIQLIGSHNSYKQSIAPALFTLLSQKDSSMMNHIDYSHRNLTDQLSMGLRNLEIDIYADSAGGRYAHPKGLDWAPGQPAYDTQGVMKAPGFKVFHIQDIDFRSNCPTFTDCLQQLKNWSAQHPGHNPVFITMNAKDETINKPGFTVPEKFTAPVLDQLDKVIIKMLGKEKVLMPDAVRGKYETLEKAVLAGNWPTLKAAKGKFIFILDETGDKRSVYIQNHPSLKNRVLFTNSAPGTPEAAIVIMNDAVQQQARIQELVKQGYIVRTRADADTREARTNDYSRFKAACASGAQIITTDYYEKSTHFPSTYSISFGKEGYFRPNPLLSIQQSMSLP